MQFQESY